MPLAICMLSLAINLACVKRDVEAHETIRNCGLVYSIDREKLQLILQQECVQNVVIGEMVFQITLAARKRKMNVTAYTS